MHKSPKFLPVSFLAVVAIGLLALCPARAATVTWDPSENGASDGSGVWDSGTTADWYTGSSDVLWPNTNATVAVFGSGGTAGTVTLGSNVTINGIVFNSNVTGSYDITSGTLTFAGTAPTITANTNAEIDSVIAGSSGLTFAGSGAETLILNGANTWTGGATVTTGTVQINSNGSLGSSANTLTLGSGVAAAVTSGGLILNNNLTVGSLVFTGSGGLGGTSTPTNNATINISSGDTLTVSGNVIVGGSGAVNNLTMSGPGNFTAGSSSAALSFYGNGTALPFHAGGTTILGNGTNTLTASTFDFADSQTTGGGHENGTNNTFEFGGGANILDANTITIGDCKSSGLFEFANSGSGSLIIAGASGGSSTANITIGNSDNASFNGTTGGILLAGHQATVQLGTLILAEGSGGTGTDKQEITFDTGSFSVNTLELGDDASGTVTTSGTFILGTGPTSTGTLTVNSTFDLTAGAGTSTANGAFTINGGMANINTNIINGATAGTHNAIINLNGGLLNMNGHNIGAASPSITVNLPTSGTAEIESLGSGGINGGGITMGNNATLILAGANAYTSAISVTSGTLQLGDGAATTSFSSTSISGTSTGVLAINLPNAGTLSNNLGDGNLVETIQGGANTLSGAISGPGVFNQNGSGSTNLTGSNTYQGATTVNAGTLLVGGSGSINGSSGITVNGGAKFVQNSSVALTPNVTLTQGTVDGGGTITNTVTVADLAGNTVQNGNGGTGTLTIGALTFNGAGIINLNDSGNASVAPLDVTGALTTGLVNLTGIVTINANPNGVWANDTTYDLINFGTLFADGSAANDNFSFGAVAGLSPRQEANFAITGSDVTLTITGDSPKWTGSDNDNWQVGSTGAKGNWKLIISGSSTNYIEGDDVVFDDTATTGTVNISAANVSPTSAEFNNNALNYTLVSGSGFGIAGTGSLIKSGTGTVTIQTPNSYTGVTLVNGGIINFQNGTAFGVSSAITVASGASVQVQGSITGGTSAMSLSGSGAANATAALESISGNNSYAGSMTLGGNATIAADVGTLTLSGGIGDGGSGYGLTTTGTGTIVFSGPNTFSGATTITEGIVNYQNGNAFGSHSAITVDNGATLQVQGGISGGSQPLAIAGAGAPNSTGVLENVSGANSFAGPITLNADSTISSDTGLLTLSGSIGGTANIFLESQSSGNGSITISTGGIDNTGAITNNSAGTGGITISGGIGSNVTGVTENSPTSTLTLSGSSAFSGTITITSGTVDAMTNNFALGTNSTVAIGANGTLEIGSSGITLGNTITGSGLIDANNLGAGSASTILSGNLSGFDGILDIGPGGGKLEFLSGTTLPSSSATINILNGGTLFMDNGGPLGTNINLFGGTIGEAFGQIRFVNTTLTGTLTLESNSVTLGADKSTGTISGPIVDNGNGYGFTWEGSGGVNTLILDGSNTYSGPTVITGTGVNTVRLGNAYAVQYSTLDPTANGQVDGITFLPGITSFNVGALEGPGNIALTDTGGGAVTMSVGANNSSNTYSGALSGAGGSFTKVGSGTQTLSGASSFSGATTVTAGILNITGSLNGTSGVIVTDATLEGTGFVSGSSAIGNGINSAGTAFLEPGSASNIGTLTTGSISLLSDAAFVLNLNSSIGSGTASELIATGVTLDPSSEFDFTDLASTEAALTQGEMFTVISTTGGLSGTFSNLPNGDIFTYGINDYQAIYASNSLTLTVVPEPETWGMMLFGFGMLIGIQKLRKRRIGV